MNVMHGPGAAVEEGIVPGGGVALLRASHHLKGLRTKNDAQKTGVEIVRKALSYPARQIAINAGEDGSVIVGEIEKDQYSYGFEFAESRIRRTGRQGYHRPDQGGSRGDPERGVGCRAADHHRSHGSGSTERRTPAAACLRVAAAWAVWVVWTSKSNRSASRRERPASLPGLSALATRQSVLFAHGRISQIFQIQLKPMR